MGKPQRKHWTWDDYAKLPDDGKRYEVLEGDLVMSPAPLFRHQEISGLIYELLRAWTRQRGGSVCYAPMDVILAEDTVCQPDLIWISPERVGEIVSDWVRGIPDLVVEILSPSTARRDRTRKADIYAKHGAREYWLVDPKDESVEIRRQDNGRFVLHATGRGETELVSTLDDALRIVPAQLFRTSRAR